MREGFGPGSPFPFLSFPLVSLSDWSACGGIWRLSIVSWYVLGIPLGGFP